MDMTCFLYVQVFHWTAALNWQLWKIGYRVRSILDVSSSVMPIDFTFNVPHGGSRWYLKWRIIYEPRVFNFSNDNETQRKNRTFVWNNFGFLDGRIKKIGIKKKKKGQTVQVWEQSWFLSRELDCYRLVVGIQRIYAWNLSNVHLHITKYTYTRVTKYHLNVASFTFFRTSEGFLTLRRIQRVGSKRGQISRDSCVTCISHGRLSAIE